MESDRTNALEGDLLEAKLDLIRSEMRAGFNHLERIVNKQDALESRLGILEVSLAESKLKLQLMGLALTLGSGSVGAFLSKIF